MNKRLFIALLLSMMVLAIYGSLMPKKSVVEQNKTAVTSAQEAPKAPVIKSSSDKNLQVPSSVKVSNGKIIATVETKKYILKFDNLGRFDSVILKEKKYRTDDGKPLDLVAKNLITTFRG